MQTLYGDTAYCNISDCNCQKWRTKIYIFLVSTLNDEKSIWILRAILKESTYEYLSYSHAEIFLD